MAFNYQKTVRSIDSVTPALANPEKVEKTRKSESFIKITLPENKDLFAESRIVTSGENHSYRLERFWVGCMGRNPTVREGAHDAPLPDARASARTLML